MTRFLGLGVAALAISISASAQTTRPTSTLFDRLAGRWILRGVIAGQQTVHDVDVTRVLNGGYMRMHEVSREKDAKGTPAYEAIVFISVDAQTGEYACLWLDTTSNAGLSATAAVGRGTPDGNSIPLIFNAGKPGEFHTTFTYEPRSNSWQWVMDERSAEIVRPFARVELTRRK